MWEGFEFRRDVYAYPLAYQTFRTLALFSKDVRLRHILEDFGIRTERDED